jgi:hypothetical protein
MTPREALDVLRRLDVAVAKAFSGAQFDYSYGHPTIAGSGGWIVPMLRWDALRLAASSARPALETLAGCVVVSVEDAKHVVGDCDCHVPLLDSSKWTDKIENHGRIGIRIRAAIAEAEEAMR